MYSKTNVFNFALNALLLGKQVTNADTDTTKEARTLRDNYDIALKMTLHELDLDSTATYKDLELVSTDPNSLWKYFYKYPSSCVLFRRIKSCVEQDNPRTRIKYSTGMLGSVKGIFTNEVEAVGHFITSEVDETALSPSAIMALSMKLAWISPTLIVGKGASDLRKKLEQDFIVYKGQAQQVDRIENFQFVAAEDESELVAARLK